MKQPVAFIPHGGGPWPFVELGFAPQEVQDLKRYLQALAFVPSQPPRALLVLSAHWEEPVPTVQTARNPPLLFDYYGFPPAAYELTWPAPGAPALAAHVRDLLRNAGIASGEDPERGYDHGTFVPLKLTYPDASIPTVQLSLKAGLDPEEHIALGRALAPLREEDVFIIGSGMSYHNLRAFGRPQARTASEAFDAWLQSSMRQPAEERNRRLVQWSDAPAAREAHPREEHLLPLMVIAGAAGADAASLAFDGTMMGAKLSAFHFGVEHSSTPQHG